MEHWPADLSIPFPHSGEQKSNRGAGSLQAVSGNRQPYTLDCHAGSENQNPHDLYHIDSAFIEAKYPSHTFPVTATLGSNEGQAGTSRVHHRHRRRHRQQGWSIDPKHQDRSYLNSKKYLEYRARQRKDLGTDNKQVWSDDVEEAFQEG
jgi:transcriptional enhancer factor